MLPPVCMRCRCPSWSTPVDGAPPSYVLPFIGPAASAPAAQASVSASVTTTVRCALFVINESPPDLQPRPLSQKPAAGSRRQRSCSYRQPIPICGVRVYHAAGLKTGNAQDYREPCLHIGIGATHLTW